MVHVVVIVWKEYLKEKYDDIGSETMRLRYEIINIEYEMKVE